MILMKKNNIKEKGMEFYLMLAVVLFFILMVAILSLLQLSKSQGTGISGAIGGLITSFANLVLGSG